MFKSLITILCVMLFVSAGSVSAGDALPEISRVPDIKGIDRSPPPGAPIESFDSSGFIDYIQNHSIVIDDIQYKLNKNVVFYSEKGVKSLKSRFYVGNLVGFMLNDDKEITSLWKLMGK